MTFAEKLVQLRKKEGYTQEELADRLEVSRQAVSRWEMGTAAPDSSNLLQISKLFKVSADYLLNDDYESDDDLPKVKEIKTDNLNQIMIYLLALEVMMLIMQFMAVVILNNVFFAVMSFIPFIAAIVGFEYAYQKNSSGATEKTKMFRKRYYKISAWLGVYFPVRLAVTAVVDLCSLSIPVLELECIILVIYMCAALLVNLTIDKRYLLQEEGDKRM